MENLTLPCEYTRNRVACQVSQGAELRQAWGDWLTELGDSAGGWEWFVTMTFREPGPNQRGWTRPGWATAKRAWKELCGAAQPALGGLAWVRMFEVQKWRGVPHIHGLVARTDPTVRRMDLVDWAWREYGMARILAYDRSRGAGYYLCKYITKDLTDIEWGGLFPGKCQGA